MYARALTCIKIFFYLAQMYLATKTHTLRSVQSATLHSSVNTIQLYSIVGVKIF